MLHYLRIFDTDTGALEGTTQLPISAFLEGAADLKTDEVKAALYYGLQEVAVSGLVRNEVLDFNSRGEVDTQIKLRAILDAACAFGFTLLGSSNVYELSKVVVEEVARIGGRKYHAVTVEFYAGESVEFLRTRISEKVRPGQWYVIEIIPECMKGEIAKEVITKKLDEAAVIAGRVSKRGHSRDSCRVGKQSQKGASSFGPRWHT